MTTYTITHHGEVVGRGWSLEDCAQKRLTDDGQRYELRTVRQSSRIIGDYTEIELWAQRRQSTPLTLFYDGPGPHGKPIVEETEAGIWPRVAFADWDDGFDVITDEEFTAREAEFARENEG